MTVRDFDGATAGFTTPRERHPRRRHLAASGATDGRSWSTVTGMTLASGRLLYATTTGTLSTVTFSGGLPTGTEPW